MKTQTVDGVECVLVPYDTSIAPIQAAVAFDIAGRLDVCGLCPVQGSGKACCCPFVHGTGSLFFPLKYWPILAMRIKGEEP